MTGLKSDEAYEGMMRLLRDQDALANGVDTMSAIQAVPLTAAEKPIIHDFVIQLKPENIFIGSHSRIDSFVKLEGGRGLYIGAHVHIASFAHIGIGGGTTILENGSAVASGGKIISGSNRPDAVSMSACAPKDEQAIEYYGTRIGRNANVCTNAVVLPGRRMGEGSILASGSVLTRDIPPYEVWGGVPARKIADRRSTFHSKDDSRPVPEGLCPDCYMPWDVANPRCASHGR